MARFFLTKECSRLEKCQTNRQIHFDTCSLTVCVYRSTIWFYKLETAHEYTCAHTVVTTAVVVIVAADATIASAPCLFPQDTTNFPLLVQSIYTFSLMYCHLLLWRIIYEKSLYVFFIYCYVPFSTLIFDKVFQRANVLKYVKSGRWHKLERFKITFKSLHSSGFSKGGIWYIYI